MTKISIWFNFPMEDISVKLQNALTQIFKTDTNFCIYIDNVYYYNEYIKPIINNLKVSVEIKCIWSVDEENNFDFSEEARQHPEIKFLPINEDINLKTAHSINAVMDYVIVYVIPILHHQENQILQKHALNNNIINLYTNNFDLIIREFLSTLPPDKQTIIDLQEKGINYKSIAEQLDISINAVYNRAASARKTLIQMLVRYLSK